MPSTMIHLVIANKISGSISISSLGEFYLGAIAPDTVNLNGKASKEIRYCAHLRSADYDEWIENVFEFSKKNKDIKSKNPDFFKGFLIHILTDIAWDQTAQPKLFELMKDNDIDVSRLNDQKWNELLAFDRRVAECDIWNKEIRPFLINAHAPCGLTVDKTELEDYRKFVLNLNFLSSCAVDNNGLITDDMIINTAKRVYELYENLIKS